MSDEYVQIGSSIIILGVIAGIIASLWTIIPFFVPGIRNIFYITVISGVVVLAIFSDFKVSKLAKSGVLALIIFLLTSYAIVPFVSGFILNNNADIPQPAEGLETLNLKLPGLFCQGCAFSAQNALKGIDGVEDAKVSFDSKSGVVVYDPNKVTPEELLTIDVIKAYGGQIG